MPNKSEKEIIKRRVELAFKIMSLIEEHLEQYCETIINEKLQQNEKKISEMSGEEFLSFMKKDQTIKIMKSYEKK